jgi:branched-chain amino acid transport system ATP-binding protein
MLIQVDAVSKRFGGLQAVDAVSLSARSGQVTAVIGPNGAGKSTLLDCLSGLTPFDSGRIDIDGAMFTSIGRGDLLEAGITRTFQTVRLFDSLTIEEHVGLARRSYLRCRRARASRTHRDEAEVCRGLLAQVGLLHKAAMRPRELSYGERRHLEIARGLATQPRLFLLDEPAAGSTYSEQARLATLIRAIADAGCAVILVEHHMDLVGQVSDEVVVLNFGRVIVTGTISEIRLNPEVISVYLGVAAQ